MIRRVLFAAALLGAAAGVGGAVANPPRTRARSPR